MLRLHQTFCRKISAANYILLFLLYLISNSCIKEDFNVKEITIKNYRPGVAFPIVNANLDLHNLSSIDSAGWDLQEDASKFMTLMYIKKERFDARTFLKISDQEFYNKYFFTLDNSVPKGDSSTTIYSTDIDFNSPENDILDLMYLDSGNLIVKINSNLNMRGDIYLSFPGITKNGNMLVTHILFLGVDVQKKVNIDGYLITFSHVGNTNRLTTECKVTAHNDGQPNLSPYNLNLTIGLDTLKFNKVFGYFGSRSFNFSSKLYISLFDGIISGDSYFENSKMHLNFINDIGIPVDLIISKFAAHSDIKAPHDIDITGVPNLIHIPAPASPGLTVNQDYLLDKTNSNVKDVINLLPNEFSYDVNGVSLTDPLHQNFIFDTSKIELDVKVEIPLYGRIRNYIFEDTVDFSFDSLDMFESLTFNLLLNNGFPLESEVQLYFMDNSYKVKDSLFVLPHDKLPAAQVSPTTGLVTQPTSNLYKIVFNHNRILMLNSCKYIKLLAKLNTSNQGQTSVKIYSDYTIDVKLSALGKLKVN